MEFRIIPSPRRKNPAVTFDPQGNVELLLPLNWTRERGEELLRRHARRIENLRRRFLERQRQAPLPSYRFEEGEEFPLYGKKYPLVFSSRLRLFDGEKFLLPAGPPEKLKEGMEQLYRNLAPGILEERCRYFAPLAGVTYNSIGITAARSRWGSCSSRGHLSFCWKILLLPPELADYVICHELAHRREMNHSPRFWAFLERFCPGAAEKRKLLRHFPEPWPEREHF